MSDMEKIKNQVKDTSEVEGNYARWLQEKGLTDWKAAYLVWVCPHCNNHGFEYERICRKCCKPRSIN